MPRVLQVELREIPLRGGSRNAFHLPNRQAIVRSEVLKGTAVPLRVAATRDLPVNR